MATRSVALLRVKFSLRSEHYKILQQSRRLGLSDPYASKLGWLVGNLYSRVATPDWEDQESKKNASKVQAKKILDVVTLASGENWVSGRELEAKLGEHQDKIEQFEPRSFKTKLSDLAYESPSELAVKEAAKIAETLALEAVDLEIGSRFEKDSELIDLILGAGFTPELSPEQEELIREDRKVIQKLSTPIAKLTRQLIAQVLWEDCDSPQEWCAALGELLRDHLDEDLFQSMKNRIDSKLNLPEGVHLPDFAIDSIKNHVIALLETHWLTIRFCQNTMRKLPGRLKNSSRFMDNTKRI